jgi:hypothetical protein
MRCPSCGMTEERAASRFCRSCGAPLPPAPPAKTIPDSPAEVAVQPRPGAAVHHRGAPLAPIAPVRPAPTLADEHEKPPPTLRDAAVAGGGSALGSAGRALGALLLGGGATLLVGLAYPSFRGSLLAALRPLYTAKEKPIAATVVGVVIVTLTTFLVSFVFLRMTTPRRRS